MPAEVRLGHPRDTRRVAAIAFADVVGYSTLMAADEHGTYARWMALLRGVIEPETARHGGRVWHVAGDGILLEFPTVDDAVSWARAVQQDVRAKLEGPGIADPLPIALRIAVHIGEVFESGSQIFGDAVNFAARLQAHAAPGAIVISERARETVDVAAARASDFRDLGYAELRGFERRARIFGIESDVVRVSAQVQGAGGMPSVAVLPLLDQEGDPEQAHFADGFAEDVAMSLAGLHELFVVSTASSAIFRGRLPDPREVGRALGVRYALLGRLHRMTGGYGVSVQLCDTRSGAALWGERMRVDAGAVFDMQDEIVRKVVADLAPQVRAAELQRAMRKPPDSLTAYDRMLRALYTMSSLDRDTFDRARAFLTEAMAEEPDFALPGRLGSALAQRAHRAWLVAEPGRGCGTGIGACHARGGHRPDKCAGSRHPRPRQHDAAARQQRRPRLLSRCARGLSEPPARLDAVERHAGLSREGAEALRRAEHGLRLSPHDPMRYSQFMFVGIAHYASGNFAEAARWQRRSATENPLHGATLLLLAAALAANGLRDEAREVGARFVALRPGFSLETYASTRLPFFDPALREAFAEHLRQAGFPD